MTYNPAILDASALLAYLMKEPGHEKLEAYLGSAMISTVNYHETIYCFVSKYTASLEKAISILSATPLTMVDYTVDHAIIAASVKDQSEPLGLSLGDRACIALGLTTGLPVVTADRSWKKLKLDIPVMVIR